MKKFTHILLIVSLLVVSTLGLTTYVLNDFECQSVKLEATHGYYIQLQASGLIHVYNNHQNIVKLNTTHVDHYLTDINALTICNARQVPIEIVQVIIDDGLSNESIIIYTEGIIMILMTCTFLIIILVALCIIVKKNYPNIQLPKLTLQDFVIS